MVRTDRVFFMHHRRRSVVVVAVGFLEKNNNKLWEKIVKQGLYAWTPHNIYLFGLYISNKYELCKKYNRTSGCI